MEQKEKAFWLGKLQKEVKPGGLIISVLIIGIKWVEKDPQISLGKLIVVIYGTSLVPGFHVP